VTWDWTISVVDIIVGALTLAAVCVALWQVGIARREANATRADMVRERRLQWELSVLASLYEQWSTTGTAHLRGHISALISDVNDPDLPLLRATVGVKSPLNAEELRAELPTGSAKFKKAVEEEIDAAIRKRVAAGSGTP
jgi:hypothetical protein